MELATAQSGGDFTLPPPGMHRAICYRFVDLGTQESEWKGETKHLRKISLAFELVDEFDEFEWEGKKISRPFSVHARFTWSMHEKGNLRPFLESWRGKGFSEADLEPGGFDAKNLVGVPCYLNVIHNESNGRTYANIKAITPLPKAVKDSMPEPHNELIYFSLQEDRFDRGVLEKLHEKMRETIQRSPEYRKVTGVEDDSPKTHYTPPSTDMDDEIPF